MKLQKLYSYTRKAIDDYNMISDGDKIAIGVSGGKDSLTLLYALHGLQRFYPKKFELFAISVDLGFGIQNFDKIKDLCDELQIPLHIIQTEIGDIVFNYREESNPCSLCSKMRKGTLNYKAKELGCNKVAYAHHKDDVVETMMLSLVYEGRFHCFSPVTFLSKMGITLIRPLIYFNESDIIGFKNRYDLPVAKNPCPADGHTKREYIKQLIRQINLDNPGVKNRMFNAITDAPLEGWCRKGEI